MRQFQNTLTSQFKTKDRHRWPFLEDTFFYNTEEEDHYVRHLKFMKRIDKR